MPEPSACQVEILTVTTTVGSEEDAQRLARGLVEQRLAACVQVDPGIRSTYRWEGRLCEDAECRLVIKTLPARLAQVEAFFAEHHPYEVPQCVAQVATASPAYAAWVRGECS